MPHQLTWTEPPTHIRVYPCPACHETISVDAPSCRFCHAPTDMKVAEQRWVENQQVTSAISRANAYSFFIKASIPITAITIWRITTFGPLPETWIACHLLAISYGAQWLSHNSSLVTDDPDYLVAVGKVKKTMIILTALVLAQVAVYLVLNGFPGYYSIVD